jgi:hypothetical protein
MKVGDLIYIEWQDAIANSSWSDKKEMEDWFENQSMIVSEVGWVYKATKEYIGVYSRRTDWSDSFSQFGLLQKIPKTWIKKIRILKLKKEVKKYVKKRQPKKGKGYHAR